MSESRSDYPRMLYHRTEGTAVTVCEVAQGFIVVNSSAEEDALGLGWSRRPFTKLPGEIVEHRGPGRPRKEV